MYSALILQYKLAYSYFAAPILKLTLIYFFGKENGANIKSKTSAQDNYMLVEL